MIYQIFEGHSYRIGVDEWMRVPSVEDVFAIGDCAGFLEHTGRQVLPALAQVISLRFICSLSFLFPVHTLYIRILIFA